MHRLIPIEKEADIPARLRGTPIGELLAYHNLGKPQEEMQAARLLIGMCMDNRKKLNIPENFAYILRAGGANLRASEFKVSYAIAVGEVQAIALIGHTQCGMVNLVSRKERFVEGLVKRAGWDPKAAEEHFFHYAPMFEIGSEVDFVLSETKRLARRYPKILAAPLIYKVEDNRLYAIMEKS
ncbi:MAG: carbonic anhydrase [Candidatus Omnitrophica bacterium CG11_big_fil_rev_8_21_14_0_20_64_10]|nr:MAG: carbonic anhydrase [Candidatus Omnitrophica bacterium CG11_big_fil_rev_8_21_14_0_20_64_10]